MTDEELARFKGLVKRRIGQEPMAYITGSRGFMNIELLTDARALVPRPDTETLVEEALKHLPKDQTLNILDVGTGTGAIALALLHERPQAQAVAVDLSEEALALAKENASALGLEARATFAHADLFDGLAAQDTFDMIVSNPPYVAESERDEMGPGVVDHEPSMALFAGDDGLDILRRLIPNALPHLKPGARLLCEMGYAQGDAVRALFVDAGFTQVEVIQDINRKDRVVSGIKAH
jgi:release factor glutamine methyltransferase